MSVPTDPTKEQSQHEDDVLERIAKIVAPDAIPVGERYGGDDAAVLSPFVGEAIVSTDVAVLGVHLDADLFPLSDLGYKAVASAVSDLAAMGARARGLVVAVTAPAGTDLESLHHGIAEAAAQTNCPVVGGDLSRGNDVTVAVTVSSVVHLAARRRMSRSRGGAAQWRQRWRRAVGDRAARAFSGRTSPTARGRGVE